MPFPARAPNLPADYVPPPLPSNSGLAALAGPVHLWDGVAVQGPQCSTFTQAKVFKYNNQTYITAALAPEDYQCPTTVPTPAIYVWDEFGNLYPNFPVYFNDLVGLAADENLSTPAVGDVTGDGQPEIVVATGEGRTAGGVRVVSLNGQYTIIEPTKSFCPTRDEQHVVLSDLNNDGKMEILAHNYDYWNVSKTYVFTYNNGTFVPYPGWPILLSTATFSEPTVVDFDNNGQKTILISPAYFYASVNSNHISAYTPNGILLWRYFLPSNRFSSVTVRIGDTNGDGQKEVIFFATEWIAGSPVQFAYILNKLGQLQTQWPLNRIYYSYSPINLTIGDLNKDAKDEIVYVDTVNIYVKDGNGNSLPGFPKSILNTPHPNPICDRVSNNSAYCGLSDIAIIDLNADGNLDLVGRALNNYRTGQIGSHQFALFAYDWQGNALPGFPYPLQNYVNLNGYNAGLFLREPTVEEINGTAHIFGSKGWGVFGVESLQVPLSPHKCWNQYGANLTNIKNANTCSNAVRPVAVDP